ncbi:hypothetical protein BDZ94DRAFT_106179 [Collybia nuda]|uniref:DUF6533 domain-containing protein n=1 Tax=Collybia nuda TaxID=64659 RepID=A0A9P5XX16_9AGAR|nr:hypothetical protein BDZ94DRAFT_106179 [Collybia nuda]
MTELTVSDLQGLSVNYYMTLISFSLLVHEYCLTFAMEVERFWRANRFTWAVFFFYLNRYLTLFGHLPVIVEYFWYSTADGKNKVGHQSNRQALIQFTCSDRCRSSHHIYLCSAKLTPYTSCRDLQSYHQYFAVTVQIWVSTLLIMRMYALYDRSRRVLALFLGVALAAVIIACWSIFTGKEDGPTPEYFLPVGCPASLSHYAATRLAAAWGGMLVFDTLVFSMTVYKSLLLRQTSGMNLLTLMLRDGSIYFGVMIASNLGNILTFVYGGLFTRGVGTTFTNVISSVMITRLMLNLRDPQLILGSQRSTSISGPVFRTLVTSL